MPSVPLPPPERGFGEGSFPFLMAWEHRAATAGRDPLSLSQCRCHEWLQHHGICGRSCPSSIPWDQQELEATFWLCPGGKEMVCSSCSDLGCNSGGAG